MTVSVQLAPQPAPPAFGRIRTNLSLEELGVVHHALDRLHMRTLAAPFSSARPPEYERSKEGILIGTTTRFGDDDVLVHRSPSSCDRRPGSDVQVTVRSTVPGREIIVSLRPAIARAGPISPSDGPEDRCSATVALAMDVVAMAIAQASRPEIAPPPPSLAVAIGAALALDGDAPPDPDGRFVFATGTSRLTPGLLRTGPRSATADVPGWETHARAIPAWTRLDGMVDDGSDGSMPRIFVDIAELRLWGRYDSLPVVDAMRAYAAWREAVEKTA